MSGSAESAASVSSSRPHSAAGDWGLASLLLGTSVLLMAPPMTVVMAVVAVSHINWTANDVRLIGLLSVIPMVCLLSLAAYGIVAAMKGLSAAKAHGETAGRASAGLLACIVALLFTLLNFLGGFFIADDMIRARTVSQPLTSAWPLEKTNSIP